MAIRTTVDAVNEILELDDAVTLTPFIESANALVDSVCLTSGYDATRLELIERWLSAHIAASTRDPRFSQEQAGPVGASYQYKIGLMLANTHYGQMAMAVDYKGNLAQLSKNLEEGKKPFSVGVAFVGPTPPAWVERPESFPEVEPAE